MRDQQPVSLTKRKKKKKKEITARSVTEPEKDEL